MSSRPDAVPGFASASANSIQPAAAPLPSAAPPIEPRRKRRTSVALGIRAQLLLVLTVFLAIPWLGYEYVKELERFLRDGQEARLAGTAQAVATALHDRGPLFETRPVAGESLAAERSGPEVPVPPAVAPA